MFGPSGRLLLVNINSNIGSRAFMNFAPFVQVQSSSTALCRYQDQVYWTLPTTQAQAVGLLFFLSLRDLYPLNQLSIRTSREFVGESVQKIMGVVPEALGVTMSRQLYNSGSTVPFISTNNVGIVYQNTQTDDNAAEVIAELTTASALITLNTTVATTVELAYTTLQVYKSKSSSKVIPPENIIISMPVPGLEATEYIASQQFAQQASSSFGTMSKLQKNLMMAGWASGHALVTAMKKYTGVTLNNKANYFNNLLAAQSSFLVGDLFIGSFGSSVCPSSSAVQQGALCNCHAGGNNIWFQSLTKSGTSFDTTSLLGGQFQYGLGMCANLRADNDDSLTTPNTAAEILDVPRTVHLVGLSPSDDEMVSDLCNQAHSTINRLANTSLYWHHSSHAVRGYCQKTTLGSASTDLTTHKASYVTTTLMGVVPDGISSAVTPPFSLVIDVMPQTTQPRISVANYVYLFPTLEQELSVLASYLAGVVTDTSAVCGVVRSSSSSAATASIISTTMSLFGINVPSEHLQQPTNNLGANIPVGCTHTVVIGIAESDAAGLLAYLKSHPTNVLLVSFDDVTKFYASIYSAFHAEDVSVTGRLVFATNLPSWTGPSLSATELSSAKALSTVPEFVQTLSPTEQTPAAVRTFLAAMLYDQLTMGTRWGQSDLSAALYGNVTVRVAGMTFGPFTKTWGGASQNLVNYGAQDIAVWSFTRVTDTSTGLLAPPRTPSLDISVASRAMNLDAVSKFVLAVRQDAGARDAEECFELQASSSNSKGPASSEKSESSLPTIDPLNSSFSTSSASATSSSASGSLWTAVYVLVALLVVVLLYIIILLLLWCGTVRWVVGFISSSRCCGVHPGNSSKTSAAKLRTRIDVEGREDRELQIMARDPCRAPDNSHDSLTFVFVEVEHWRLLWVRQAEVMSRSVRYYNRCLRLTAVELQCYEMESVEGMFVVACPSAFTGLQFARTVVEKVAELTASDADILAAEYKIFGCGNGPAGGLRVRAAIHSGLAMRKVGASGRVKWTGTTVVGVITSAYIAGKAGMIVLTRSATRAIESTNANVGTLQSAGVYSLTPNMEEELLLLEVLPSSDTALDGAGKRDVDSTYAVRMLGKSDNCEDGATCAMCVAMLDEHYADISERERIYDLQWISQRCGLLSPDMCAAQHVYYQALQASVCRHLAALLECRLGVPRAVRMRSQLSITGSSRRPSQWNSREVSAQAARKALRKTSKRRLFFAYSRHGDGD